MSEPARLRDYFLRLGAHAEVVEGASGPLVQVESADLEIEEFLDSWVAINGIAASIMQQPVTLTRRLGAVPAPSRPRLGDLLLAKGMITDPQLKEALAE